MSNVIELSSKRPHLSGTCRCLECKHEWVGVAPIGVTAFECPNCGCIKGVWKCPVELEASHFMCNCGNFLFLKIPDYIYCIRCGVKHNDNTV